MKRAVCFIAACALACSFAAPAAAASSAEHVLRFDPVLTSVHSETLGKRVLTGLKAKPEGTSVKDVLQYVKTDADHTPIILTKDGATAPAGQPAATGMKVAAKNKSTGKTEDEHVLIVAGDVTGSGKLSLTQLVRMVDAVSGKNKLTGEYEQAGDHNGNGHIDLSDLVILGSELSTTSPNQSTAPRPTAAPVSNLQPPDLASMLPPNVLLGRMQEQFLLKVDRARTQEGLPVAEQSKLLDDAAQAMAEKISETKDPESVSMEKVLDLTGEHWQNVTTIPAYKGVESVANDSMKAFETEGTSPLEEKIAFTGVGVARSSKGVWTVVQLYTENEPRGWKNGALTPRGWTTEVLGGTEDCVGTASGITKRITDVKPVYNPDTSEAARKAINAGMEQIMKPYAYNTTSTEGFDCSGFVYYALKKGGMEIMRDSSSGYAENPDWPTIEKIEDLKTGDLLFFGEPDAIFHVGIYIGDGIMLHAAPSIGGVGYNTVETGYYNTTFAWGKRVF